MWMIFIIGIRLLFPFTAFYFYNHITAENGVNAFS